MAQSDTEKADLRVALVGYGLAGSVFHAPLISCTQGMRLSAIVCRDPARRESARIDHPDAELLDSPAQLWQRNGEFDLAVIASPNSTHAPLAMAALEAGINVLIDKPMAVTAADCAAVIDLSKSKGKLLTVFQNRRLDADFLTVQLLMRSKALGKINRYESRFERWRPVPKPGSWRELSGSADGGGLLFDLGAHLIDQALVLFGRPLSVYAETDVRRQNVQSDDDCFVALTFDEGVRAHLWMSTMVRKPAPRFRICGMLGSFEKYGLDPQEDALRAGRRPDAANWGSEPSELWGTISSEREGLHYEGRVETLRGDYPAFYRQLRDAVRGESPPPVDPEEALLTMVVLEAARLSAEKREVVQL